MNWFKQLFSRRRRYTELSESIREHLDEKIADLMDRGMTREQAESTARREFGSVTRIEERSREVWQWPGVEGILADIRYAIRQLFKSPAFAITAVLTLALGIGANTAIFSVMHAVLLRMLPVYQPQQLFYLTHQNEPPNVSTTGDTRYTYGINVYERLRQDRSVFSDLIAYVPLSLRKVAVRFGDSPDEASAEEVSGNFFSALGVDMAAGRAFAPIDEERHSAVAVLSYGYWTRRFERNPDVIGQILYVNGVPMTVIGIAGPRFTGVQSGGDVTDIWVPLQDSRELTPWGESAAGHTLYGNPNWWCLMLMARLRPGVSQQQALARMNPLFAHAAWETAGKEVKQGGPSLSMEMVPARGLGLSASDLEEPMKILMGMVALVLIIACVNLLMLLAARNTAREGEFSVRLALGAGRWALLRQLLSESVLLVGAGALLAWVFALEATKLLAAWSGLEVSLAPNATVLAFTLAVSAGMALLFGLAPLRAAMSAPVSAALKSGRMQTTLSRRHMLVGKALIAGQMAICVTLLLGAGLLIRTLSNYNDIDLGMQADQVLAFGAHPIGTDSDLQMRTFYSTLMERLRELPGVRSVTVAAHRPGSGWVSANLLVMDGRHYEYNNGRGMLFTNAVGPDFFETLGIPILAGRGIETADNGTGLHVAVVNKTFADRFLKGESPIGHTLGDGTERATIVGMVRDNKYQSADEGARAMAWYSFEQSSAIGPMDVEVRVAGNPMALLTAIRDIVRQIAPNAPVENPMLLKTEFEQSYRMPRLFARLGAFFGGLAVLLVAVGLYGMLAYGVNRRKAEIGVRLAVGAARTQVLWMIFRESISLLVVGLAVGLPLAWMTSHWMASMLYRLSPHDPFSFVAASAAILVVSIAAAFIPARRAASVDPMQVLRNE